MPSQLFSLAFDTLPDAEKQQHSAFESWLRGLARPQMDGKQMLANMQDESHLVGAGAFGDPAELARFLKTCAQAYHRAGSELQRHAGHSSACHVFELKGLPVEQAYLPTELIRYSTSKATAADLIERMLGTSARSDFMTGLLSVEDAFNRLAHYWIAARLTDNDNLARGDVVFTTFEHPGDAPRNDAKAMAEALALPVLLRSGSGGNVLFELTYRTDSVKNHRFPTVADAAFFHLFRPAREVAPDPADPKTLYGWTNPLDGQQPQPEIVHENARLRVVRGAPRLVGRMTL